MGGNAARKIEAGAGGGAYEIALGPEGLIIPEARVVKDARLASKNVLSDMFQKEARKRRKQSVSIGNVTIPVYTDTPQSTIKTLSHISSSLNKEIPYKNQINHILSILARIGIKASQFEKGGIIKSDENNRVVTSIKNISAKLKSISGLIKNKEEIEEDDPILLLRPIHDTPPMLSLPPQ